jgi:hypothetical protein
MEGTEEETKKIRDWMKWIWGGDNLEGAELEKAISWTEEFLEGFVKGLHCIDPTK